MTDHAIDGLYRGIHHWFPVSCKTMLCYGYAEEVYGEVQSKGSKGVVLLQT